MKTTKARTGRQAGKKLEEKQCLEQISALGPLAEPMAPLVAGVNQPTNPVCTAYPPH